MTDEDHSFWLAILWCPSASEQLVAPGIHSELLHVGSESLSGSDWSSRRPQPECYDKKNRPLRT